MAHSLPKLSKLVLPYRVTRGKGFQLENFDPADTQKLDLKRQASTLLQDSVARLSDLQQKLYAQDRWAVLIVLQAMDAAGKDSVIRHVMSGVNPQGCQVYSFKTPSAEELSHDFLWRTSKSVPERGHIGIFNRSYYEEVLVVRVHPELLAKEHLPATLVGKAIWKERFADIAAFENYLTRNGIVVLKFFLNVSKREQKRRFLARLDEPDKNWKFSETDVKERAHWNDYARAYQDMIRHTASAESPWHVVPADNKWFTRLVVARTIIEKLECLGLHYPKVDKARKQDLDAARRLLKSER